MTEPWKFERSHYRIEYPVPARPRVHLTGPFAPGVVADVVDCSERGLRFALPIVFDLPEIGTPVGGHLVFRSGAELDVAGVVVRLQEGEVAIRFGEKAIPLAVVLGEQRWLRAHYPMR